MNKTVNVTTPSDCEIQVTREFNAPAQLIFDYHTKPEKMRIWLIGPPGWSLTVCEIDLRVGGQFRNIFRSDTGPEELGVRGEFREIVAPTRLAHTETMDGIPGEWLETLVLKQSGATTTATTTWLYASRDARDQALKSGIIEGASFNFDRLEQLMSEAA